MDFTVAVSNDLLEKHKCKAIIATCIDFRFLESTFVGFAKSHLGIETFDALTAPGCAKSLLEESSPFKDYLIHGIALSLKLHHPEQLVLVHHSTCGAYGIADAEAESAKQKADLITARSVLRKLFPSLQIRIFFANAKLKEEIIYEEVA